MRITDAARYARWSALAAILLAVVVAGVYSHRAWRAYQAKQNAPPPVPTAVQQQSAQFTFSKVEKDRTLFTVRASRATEFKGGQKSLLEDVWITVFGSREQRFDNLHTRACDYGPDTGLIVCTGEVRIDLESAEEARERPGERVIQVSTSHVSFDTKTGEAKTDQTIAFRTPDGEGRAVGLTYSTRHGVVRLLRDVQLTLTTPLPGQQTNGTFEPLILTSSSLEFRRSDLTIRLHAPVAARQNSKSLQAGELAIEMDRHLRARRVVADGAPRLRSAESDGMFELTAEKLTAAFGPTGLLDGMTAEGRVRGSYRPAAPANSKDEDRLAADRAELEMQPGRGIGRSVLLSGNVLVERDRKEDAQRLETPQLELVFSAASTPQSWQLERGEMPASARISGKTAAQSTQASAQRLTTFFGAQGQVRELRGQSGVEVQRRIGAGPELQSNSRELVVRFGPRGEWSDMEQTGSVRVRHGDRTAQAERSRIVRATDTATLDGSVVLSDPEARTTARNTSFNQRTGEVRAEGDVRTTYLRVDAGGALNLGPQPAHLSSDRLLGNLNAGRAIYSGRVRLWQGDATIEAETIELLRQGTQQGQLIARGNVLAVFPQAAGPAGSRGGPAGPDLMRVRAGSLTYSSADRRARLEQGVNAQSLQGQISAGTVDLFFAAGGNGVQQISRALATGNVIVRQGDRRGTSEQAEYSAAEGKFVLFGGRPTLYDASRGTTTGRQLTFFFADDTIVMDSEQGTRTLTRHRVEK